jgi:O-antigen ligase
MSHVSSRELLLRVGAWETGIRVILAHPLLGLGLSFYIYLTGAEPYRVALQDKPLYHPHNSFLEIGALGGLPLLAVFVAIFANMFWRAFRSYRAAEHAERILLAGGLSALVSATVNSFAANTWTLPPLVLVNWVIAGALVSSALTPPRPRRPALAARRRATALPADSTPSAHSTTPARTVPLAESASPANDITSPATAAPAAESSATTETAPPAKQSATIPGGIQS